MNTGVQVGVGVGGVPVGVGVEVPTAPHTGKVAVGVGVTVGDGVTVDNPLGVLVAVPVTSPPGVSVACGDPGGGVGVFVAS